MRKNQSKKFHYNMTATALGPALGAGVLTANFTASLGALAVYISACIAAVVFAFTNWFLLNSKQNKSK